jgi:hypothetical protein
MDATAKRTADSRSHHRSRDRPPITNAPQIRVPIIDLAIAHPSQTQFKLLVQGDKMERLPLAEVGGD